MWSEFRLRLIIKAFISICIVVAAPLPALEHCLVQSNIDFLMDVKTDMNNFFCYKKPSDHGRTFESLVNVLKLSLSQALVPYYALAGEMVTNSAGEPEILCNNRGVDFTEADAVINLRELDLFKPDESIHGKLLPALKNGAMLAVQVTQLSCGGVVVGCMFDHRASDAHSANMFLVSWAEMAQSKPLSTFPSFRRSRLSPRRPGRFDPSVTDMYVPASRFQPCSKKLPSSMVCRIYSVPAQQLENLQRLANHENPSSLIRKRTKVEALTAFMWKLIVAGTKEGENSCQLGILVDGRSRIADNGSMSDYYGNIFSYAFGRKTNKELKEMPLSSIANEIHRLIYKVAKKDHFLGLIDYVEAHKPEMVHSKIFEAQVSKEDPVLMVSSWRGFSMANMDFGWGAPVFGSILPPLGKLYSCMMPMQGLSPNGDWVVYMRLQENQVDLIEQNAAHIFKPFTLG